MEKRKSPSERIRQMFAYPPGDTNVLREEQRRFASREYFFQKIVEPRQLAVSIAYKLQLRQERKHAPLP